MKLYEVPRNTLIRVKTPDKAPPGARPPDNNEIIKFGHIDGMYSFCHDKNGNIVHLASWTEVEIV